MLCRPPSKIKDLPMEMHQIRYFLAVARTLNFTRAATQCNVTQPSLTRAIQKLEDEFGGPLFNRERAMTHLTELGRMVLPHLEQTFDAAEAATTLAGSIGRAEVTPLVIGVADGIASPVLHEILAALAEAMPGLALDLRSGTSDALIEASMKGGIDLLVVALPHETHDRLESWPLFALTFAIAMWPGHRLAHCGTVSMGDVAEETWIDCADDGTALWRTAMAGAGVEPAFRHRVERSDQALKLVAQRLGLAIVPKADTAGHTGVTFADCAGHDLRRNIVLAAVGGRRRGRAADAFLRAARARDWQAVQPGERKDATAASTSDGSAR
jgi:DNA-binding transcriptional LysR family regulator